MSFSSSVFLFVLLPWFALAARGAKKNISVRKIILLIGNSVFYIWGGTGGFLFAIFYSVAIWSLSKGITRKTDNTLFFHASIIIAALPLVYVKYVSFFIRNINSLMHWNISVPTTLIPIGISFFTFEAISLLVDLHKGIVSSCPAIQETFLYLTFLPTVTSGPITRYSDFEYGLNNHSGYESAVPDVERIILGLCKKVLIADKLAPLVNYYFEGVAAGNNFSLTGLWIGSIAFSLQLFYDFSGYTDMAIGIGRLLGFELRENFDHPYTAESITDFWRRWHISLSRWFRDYIYIPMGGNRCPVKRHLFNLLTVWLLTGIWHGADWSFVLWGIGYFILLVMEKYVPMMKKFSRKWYGHIYTLFWVNLLWVLFRAENVSVAGKYVFGMFCVSRDLLPEEHAIHFLPYLFLAIILCLPWNRYLSDYVKNRWLQFGRRVVILTFAVLAICAVINANYAPYIYGSF